MVYAAVFLGGFFCRRNTLTSLKRHKTQPEIKRSSASMQNTLFANVEEQPRDPILGMTETFLADKAPHRVNLGVGVYQDENGKVPLLACVKQAEESLLAKSAPHTYAPIDGLPAYDSVVAKMVFADSADLANIATVQTLGGTGALKLGAEMLRVTSPNAKVWLSNPELGEPPRAVRRRRLHGRVLPLLRRRRRTGLRRHGCDAGEDPGGRHRAAARLLP